MKNHQRRLAWISGFQESGKIFVRFSRPADIFNWKIEQIQPAGASFP